METNRRIHWSEEGVAYARYRLAKVLQELGEHDEAAIHESQAGTIRDKLLKAHPEYLQECPENEVAIYDQIIPIWSGRSTYRTKEGMAITAVGSKEETLDVMGNMSPTIDEIEDLASSWEIITPLG